MWLAAYRKVGGFLGLLALVPSLRPNRNFATSESGSALIEFSMALLPLMALLLLVVDVAWAIFARATLQNAVREGVRYAVTGQILTGQTCLGASVQQVVSQNSFGFIPASKASSYVTVTYYSPSTMTQITGSGGPAGGNVVWVAASGVSIRSFGPLWRSLVPVPLSAVASDVMESSSNGVTPCP